MISRLMRIYNISFGGFLILLESLEIFILVNIVISRALNSRIDS